MRKRYSEPSKTSKMKIFAKIVVGCQKFDRFLNRFLSSHFAVACKYFKGFLKTFITFIIS